MLASAHPELNSYDGWYGIMENLEYIRELLNELSRYNNAEHLSPVQTDITLLLKKYYPLFPPCAGLPWDHSGNRYSPDPSPSLSGPAKIHQALLNLLRNAQESIQHSHGVISVTAAAVTDGICISVRDNGCGMTDSQIKNVFNPFVTYKPTGTGLGLPVTRQIIEAHGGSLKVRSVPGKGTEFQIFFRL